MSEREALNAQDITARLYPHKETIDNWLRYLREIESKYDVKCVLAGGCFRDLLLGVPIKDLDVFVIGDPDPAIRIEDLENFDSITFADALIPKIRWRKVVNLDYGE